MSEGIEYVSVGDTIADIANQETTNASLTTTTSILLSILVIASFLANALLIATILSSYKLRNCLLYVCFVNIALLNILDTLFIMSISLLYLANGQWCLGDVLCRINALMQQFIFLKALLAITLMAMERALGLVANGNRLIAPKYILTLSMVFTIVGLCFAAPLMLPSFPVKPYRYRYLCAIDSYSPIAYTIVQIWVYSGCLFVLLICFGSMIRHSQHSRSLPVKPQDYSAFIMETRALQDHLGMGKLVFYIMLAYLLVQGPYIVLNFFVQVRNSAEILKNAQEIEVPQDADTLITWIKFFFPIVVPILIYINCHDIWTKLKNLTCCRRSTAPALNNWAYNRPKTSMPTVAPNVLTLVATSEGLQLRVPDAQPQVQPTVLSNPDENHPRRISREQNNNLNTGSQMQVNTRSLPSSNISSPQPSSNATTSTMASDSISAPTLKPAQQIVPKNIKKRTTTLRNGKSKTRRNAPKGSRLPEPTHWKY